jgi:phosphonate transport system substrate-binding protein
MVNTVKSVSLMLLILLIIFTSIAYSKDALLIGLVPGENIFNQMDRYKPVVDYLSSKLNIEIKLTILSKYGDIIDKFLIRNMDGAFFEGLTGVIAMERLGAEPLAVPIMSDGSHKVKYYVIVKKNSDIKDVKDMKGKRIVFVDKATTGYLFVMAFLKENGISNMGRYFKECYFTGGHDSVIYAVLDNRADVGVIDSKSYRRIIGKDPVIKEELSIISESEEFLDINLYLKKDLPSDIKTKIKNTLLNMEKDVEGRKVLSRLGALRFIELDKGDFAPFFSLAKKAGIKLKEYNYR